MSGKKVRKLKTEKEMETERSTAKKGQAGRKRTGNRAEKEIHCIWL